MGLRCTKLCNGPLLPDCGMRDDARCAAPQAVVGPVRYSCKKCDCVRTCGVRSSVFRSGFYLGLKVRTLERLLRALDEPRSEPGHNLSELVKEDFRWVVSADPESPDSTVSNLSSEHAATGIDQSAFTRGC